MVKLFLFLKLTVTSLVILILIWIATFASQNLAFCCLSTTNLFKISSAAAMPIDSSVNQTIPDISNQVNITFPATNDYLANPGIGWQETTTITQPRLPETVSYRRRQYSWALLNPKEGVIDWSPIDNDLAEATALGKQLSFRVYTMRGENYGGHQVPQWVIDQGAVILKTGEPYYSNCVYLEKWAQFVEEMRQKYDGNPHIAWIDISGYGNFNEWSWHEQTSVFDNSLDGEARQRLADIFIGGSASLQCAARHNNRQTITYTYPGFQHTQLLMPYAGIRQSTRYVASRRSDVGFRHDCLGSAIHTDDMLLKVGDVIDTIWRYAPVVYEFCSYPDLAAALPVLKSTHASLVHDNIGDFGTAELTNLLRFVGYRFTLKQASYSNAVAQGGTVDLATTWVNRGYAPTYPRMGQKLALNFLLVDDKNQIVQEWQSSADLAQWMPAATITDTPPANLLKQKLALDPSIAKGNYQLKVSIIDQRTNQPIYLALSGRDTTGRYTIGPLSVVAAPKCCNVYIPLILRSIFFLSHPTTLFIWLFRLISNSIQI